LNARYLHEANERVTLIVQIESRAGLDNIEEISAVDGVDALFIADLAASLGHIGDPLHSEVQEAIARAKAAIDRSGKPAGIFAVSVEDARNRIDQGFRFISVGTDIGLLLAGASEVLNAVRSSTPR
jgi:4-hydroxy-2-oxoheptanedioate aldolase